MNNKKNDLAKRYEDICNEYLVAFCKSHEIAVETDDVWVAGDVGTIACLGDYFFDFHDVIKYSVDNGLHDWSNIMEWYDYTLFAAEYGQTIPNFAAWCKGCPRLSESEQQRLRDLKNDFESAVKDYKERTDKKNNGLF